MWEQVIDVIGRGGVLAILTAVIAWLLKPLLVRRVRMFRARRELRIYGLGRRRRRDAGVLR